MARAVYPHELQDQDFSWLITRFQENNPNYALVDISSLPLVLIEAKVSRAEFPVPYTPPSEVVPKDLSGDEID